MPENHLISMFREQPQFEGGPTQAFVHPDEVDNFIAAGWICGETDQTVESQNEPEPYDQEKPLSEQSIIDLRRTAKRLGVKFTPKTNSEELRGAIMAAQASGE